MRTKTCTECGEDLPLDAFGLRAAGRFGCQAKCRSCMAARNRARRAADPDARAKERAYEQRPDVQRRSRARRAAARCGISAADYELIYAIQNGECALCYQSHPKLFLDHDHLNGRVRGLLCPNCNNALGMAGDDPERLRKMADYVESHRMLGDLSDDELAAVLR